MSSDEGMAGDPCFDKVRGHRVWVGDCFSGLARLIPNTANS